MEIKLKKKKEAWEYSFIQMGHTENEFGTKVVQRNLNDLLLLAIELELVS